MFRRIVAEGIGSLLLAAGNVAIALIANTGATVAVLATLIALLGPMSGAHFNPAVSLVQALRGALSWRAAARGSSCMPAVPERAAPRAQPVVK